MDEHPVIISGAWQTNPSLTDYRAEWLSEVLVERATWAPTAEPQQVGDAQVAGPGYIWFRFWFLEDGQVMEKYFDAEGNPVGVYVPICMPLERENSTLSTQGLILALWIEPDGRVTVLHEEEFDAKAMAGELTPVQVEHAEYRIRELTTAIGQNRFPPALVRNFAITVK